MIIDHPGKNLRIACGTLLDWNLADWLSGASLHPCHAPGDTAMSADAPASHFVRPDRNSTMRRLDQADKDNRQVEWNTGMVKTPLVPVIAVEDRRIYLLRLDQNGGVAPRDSLRIPG